MLYNTELRDIKIPIDLLRLNLKIKKSHLNFSQKFWLEEQKSLVDSGTPLCAAQRE